MYKRNLRWRSKAHFDDSCAGQALFAGAGVELYMWPGGRICSNCALARKRSAQSGSTAWIFAGGDGKMGGLQHSVGVGGARRRWERADESGTRCFILFLVPQGHGICGVRWENRIWATVEGIMSVLPAVIVYHLAGTSGGGSQHS